MSVTGPPTAVRSHFLVNHKAVLREPAQGLWTLGSLLGG